MIKVNQWVFVPRYFPDGTLNMTELIFNIFEGTDKITIFWRYENLAEQAILQNLVEHFKDIYDLPIILDMPYVPNARMDRVKNPKSEIHTLKHFCKFINDLDFAKVYVTDVHSPVTMTLLNRAIDRNISSKIKQILSREKVDYFFFPDKGALERYSYLDMCEPLYGEKVRDWKTGKITDYAVKNPCNIGQLKFLQSTVLIIDDISSYGTTFFNAAHELKQMGFGKILLYITHAENSILDGKLINDPNIDHIYTTNSIFTGKNEKISII